MLQHTTAVQAKLMKLLKVASILKDPTIMPYVLVAGLAVIWSSLPPAIVQVLEIALALG